ncbi:MAG: hypothetical protein ACHQQ3_00260 [Gemmatimonadales bacterium]
MRATECVALAMLALACSGKGADGPGSNCVNGVCPFTDTPAPPGGVAQFTVLPVAVAPGQSLTALGNLAPPGHVLPTDHVYFYAGDLRTYPQSIAGTAARTVYMPATGALFIKLQSNGSDWKLMFRATENFYFYLDHVTPTVPMNIGDVFAAGTAIGTSPPGNTVDLGAFDQTVTRDGFLSAGRYAFQTLHYVSPWKYFAPVMQPSIYAQVYRAPGVTDKDGKIDFGVAGKLVGDWFLQGLPVDSSAGPSGWPKTVAFAYDYYDPSQVRISIGGTIAAPGVWAIDATVPQPANVSVASGLVAYRLLYTEGRTEFGLMLVQMMTDSVIRIEVFPGSSASTGQFDANVWTFVR